jgi:hypothetical protein
MKYQLDTILSHFNNLFLFHKLEKFSNNLSLISSNSAFIDDFVLCFLNIVFLCVLTYKRNFTENIV